MKTYSVNTIYGKGKKVIRQRKKKYEMVADRLRECISEGVYTHKLPGVKILAEELETNPMTLGTAIKILVEEGLLYRVPRSGTYLKKENAVQKSTIALVVSDVQAPNTAHALARIGQLAGERKLNLLYFSHGNNAKEESAILRTIVKEHLASGVIWWPTSMATGVANQEILVEANVPFVVLEMTWRGIRGGCVLTDFFAGFRDLTKYMVGLGHKRVLFVIDHGSFETDPRYLAYRSVLEVNDLECFPAFEFNTQTLSEKRGGPSDATRRVAAHLKSFDALICVHDRFGAHVFQFLLRHGISCPADVALASFDGLEMAELLGITSYSQPMGEIGETALEILLGTIEDPEVSPRRVLMQGELHERHSTETVSTALISD